MPSDTTTLEGDPPGERVDTDLDDAHGQVLHAARVAIRYAVLTLLALIVLFPVYITIVNSLLRPDQIAARPPSLFVDEPQWHTFADAWSAGHLGRYLLNSFVVTGLIVVGEIITAVLAAYAFAYIEFPFKKTIFFLFLATMMVPFEVVFFTNFRTIKSFGLYDSYAGLALPFMATGFGAFLIRQAFLTTPRELEDAAAMDGAGHFRFLWRVAIPLARPAIAALAVFSFLSAWGQYLWPLIATDDERFRTVQVGLRQLRGTSIDQINVTFAGVVLASIPLFVLLVVFQKQLVRGLTAGAVKG